MSSDKQVDGYSLDSQDEKCQDEANRQGYEVIKIFREEGISAKTTDRPQLNDLLRFTLEKNNNINSVFVYHSSRLARNTLDFLLLRRDLAKHGISITSVTEPNIGNDTPESRLISTVLAGMNQYENENRGRNVANSMKKRFLEGHITSKPPLGYIMQKVNGKSIAVKDDTWFLIIKRMWQRMAIEHLSLREIARELNKLKRKRFTKSSIEKIFNNKFYYGVLVSQKYGEALGKHEPMIDEMTFYNVQKIFKSRLFTARGRTLLREDFMLRFLLHCHNCNARLTSAWSMGKRKKYAYYFCLNCDKRQNMPRDTVESKFIELLQSIKPNENSLQYFAEHLKEQYESNYQELTTAQKTIEDDVKMLENTLIRIRNKHRDSIYSDEEYLEMKEDIKIQLMGKKSLLSEKKIDKIDIDTTINFMKFYFENLDKIFLKASPEGRLKVGCSIFPIGVIFDGYDYRTPELGLGYKLISDFISSPSTLVSRLGLEPRTNSLKGNCSTS